MLFETGANFRAVLEQCCERNSMAKTKRGQSFEDAILALAHGLHQDSIAGTLKPLSPSRPLRLYCLLLALSTLTIVTIAFLRRIPVSGIEDAPTPRSSVSVTSAQRDQASKQTHVIAANPGSLAPTREKRRRSSDHFCAPTGWIQPEPAELERILEVLDAASDSDSPESITGRLIALPLDQERLRYALLMTSPSLVGDEARAVAIAIGRLPGPPMERLVRDALQDSPDALRAAWLMLLGYEASPMALDWLLPMLMSGDRQDWDVILCVAQILKRFPSYIQSSLIPYHYASVQQQRYALSIYSQVTGCFSPEMIVPFLTSGDSRVRLLALEILAQSAETSRVIPVHSRFFDADVLVRIAACKVASRQRDISALRILRGLPPPVDKQEAHARYLTWVSVSGKSFPDEPFLWESWWKSEGAKIETEMARILNDFYGATPAHRARAVRELVRYNNYVRTPELNRIRQELLTGTPQMKLACAFYLLAARIELTPAEAKACASLQSR
jgi:hypothetical protein